MDLSPAEHLDPSKHIGSNVNGTSLVDLSNTILTPEDTKILGGLVSHHIMNQSWPRAELFIERASNPRLAASLAALKSIDFQEWLASDLSLKEHPVNALISRDFIIASTAAQASPAAHIRNLPADKLVDQLVKKFPDSVITIGFFCLATDHIADLRQVAEIAKRDSKNQQAFELDPSYENPLEQSKLPPPRNHKKNSLNSLLRETLTNRSGERLSDNISFVLMNRSLEDLEVNRMLNSYNSARRGLLDFDPLRICEYYMAVKREMLRANTALEQPKITEFQSPKIFLTAHLAKALSLCRPSAAPNGQMLAEYNTHTSLFSVMYNSLSQALTSYQETRLPSKLALSLEDSKQLDTLLVTLGCLQLNEFAQSAKNLHHQQVNTIKTIVAELSHRKTGGAATIAVLSKLKDALSLENFELKHLLLTTIIACAKSTNISEENLVSEKILTESDLEEALLVAMNLHSSPQTRNENSEDLRLLALRETEKLAILWRSDSRLKSLLGKCLPFIIFDQEAEAALKKLAFETVQSEQLIEHLSPEISREVISAIRARKSQNIELPPEEITKAILNFLNEASKYDFPAHSCVWNPRRLINKLFSESDAPSSALSELTDLALKLIVNKDWQLDYLALTTNELLEKVTPTHSAEIAATIAKSSLNIAEEIQGQTPAKKELQDTLLLHFRCAEIMKTCPCTKLDHPIRDLAGAILNYTPEA